MISKTHKFMCVCNMRVASQSLTKTLLPFCLHENGAHYTALELKSGNFTSPASIRMSKEDNLIINYKENWDNYFNSTSYPPSYCLSVAFLIPSSSPMASKLFCFASSWITGNHCSVIVSKGSTKTSAFCPLQ